MSCLNELCLKKKKKHGSEDIFVSVILTNLGMAYGALKYYRRRKEMLTKALIISDNSDVAYIGTLYHVYLLSDDQRKGIELLERALPIMDKEHVRKDFDVAETSKQLGMTYGNLRKYDKAAEWLERALPFFGE